MEVSFGLSKGKISGENGFSRKVVQNSQMDFCISFVHCPDFQLELHCKPDLWECSWK